MKRSICTALLLLFISPLITCSTYSTFNDIKDSSILSKIKNTGIIFRIPKSSKIGKDEFITNCLYWLSTYEQNENVIVIKDAGDPLTYFQNPQDRFYQLSNESNYLKFKSIGVLNLYLTNNQNELANLISKYKLDSVIIYEVYTVISSQLQFFEFETVLAVVDSNLNVAYLDHQKSYFDSVSNRLKDLKNQIMDKTTGRLMEKLQQIDLVGSMVGIEKNNKKIVKPVVKEKSAEKIEEKPVIKPAETSKTEITPPPPHLDKKEIPEDNKNPKDIKKEEQPQIKPKDTKAIDEFKKDIKAVEEKTAAKDLKPKNEPAINPPTKLPESATPPEPVNPQGEAPSAPKTN